MNPDYTKYLCCGYEHRWLPGAGKWVSTGPVRCSANSMEQLEDVRALLANRGISPSGIRSLLTMPYEEYQRRKKPARFKDIAALESGPKMTANDDFTLNLKMNTRILALESRLAAALRRKAKPSPAAISIALVGLSARLKLRQIALREHIARQENFQHFADRLNALRLDRGLTFEELGARACIPAGRVQAALHGDLDTELRDLVGLCLALKVRAQIALVPTVGGQPTVIPIGHTLPKDET